MTLAGVEAGIAGTPTDNEIIVITGESTEVTSGPVIVTTPAGSATSADDFNYVVLSLSCGAGTESSPAANGGDLAALILVAALLAMPRVTRGLARAHGGNR